MATGRRHVRNGLDYFYLVTGILITLTGLLYGFIPVDSECGSPFSPTEYGTLGGFEAHLRAEIATAECKVATQGALQTSLVMMLAGAILTIVAAIWIARSISPSAAAIIEAQEDQALLDRYADDDA